MTQKPARQGLMDMLMTAGAPELGPGPRAGILSESAIDKALERLLEGSSQAGTPAQLIRSLILLAQDHFDAAHAIAQDIGNADGSYVHAILHRREPDYSNAAYWFRRVGRPAAFKELAQRVSVLLEGKNETALSKELVPGGEWDPFAFIHQCECAARLQPGDPQVKLLQEIQRVEFETLLDRFYGADKE